VTYGPDCPVEGGSPFTKVWRVRNDTDGAWPEHVRLVFVGGDVMGFEEAPVAVTAVPGAEVDIRADLVAPAAAGHYAGYFRLADADGRRFGNRLGVRVVVVGAGSGSDAGEGGEGEGGASVAAATTAAGAEMAEAAVAALMAGTEWGEQVETLRAAGFPLRDPSTLALVLRKLTKFRGNVERTHAWLTKYVARQDAITARRACKQAKRQAKREAKKQRKQSKKEAKRKKNAIKRAKKKNRKAKKASSSSDSSSSSSTSSSSSSSDSD